MSITLTDAEREALVPFQWGFHVGVARGRSYEAANALIETVEQIISDRLAARDERLDQAVERAEAQPCRISAAHTGEALRLALTPAARGGGLGGRWGAWAQDGGVTPENLRWAATHEALSRSFIFDVLTALADALEREDEK